MLRPETLSEPKPVLDREAAPVVVEVRVDVRALAPLLDPRRPDGQLLVRVVAVTAAVVEAEEGEVGGQLAGLEGPSRIVADHERDAVAPEQLVGLADEPARVPELERVAAGREPCQRVRQPLVVPRKVGRQLPEHRAELRRADERVDALVEASHRLAHVGQPLQVGHVPARLDAEEKARRALLDPARDRLHRRQAIEGVVDLDGVEQGRVVPEPPDGRQPLRVDDLAPVLVVPARAAYADNAAAICAHSSSVPAATTRERPSRSSGAAPNGGRSGKSIASPRSRTSSWAAAMSTERAAFSEQTPSTRPSARWQSEIASEPKIRRR